MNTVSTQSGYHDYPLQVIEGELYEIWLYHNWNEPWKEPKSCIAISRVIPADFEDDEVWQILVDGTICEILRKRIFKTGTATQPEDLYSFSWAKGFRAHDIMPVKPLPNPTAYSFYTDTNCIIGSTVNYTTKGEPT